MIWFLLLSNLLIPFTMIGCGYFFKNHTPKEINPIFGYRTTMSMRNTDTWQFAHKIAGKLWLQWGSILLVLTIISMFLIRNENKDTMSLIGTILNFLQIILLVGSIIPVEHALRKNFDKNGNRK